MLMKKLITYSCICGVRAAKKLQKLFEEYTNFCDFCIHCAWLFFLAILGFFSDYGKLSLLSDICGFIQPA